MSSRQAKSPGPDHPISITPSGTRVRVIWKGRVVAESDRALDLHEAAYPVVRYIPRADVKMDLLEKTAHSTFCPYKGDASYYALVDGGERTENAIWSYEQPFEAMAPIEGYIAFYGSKVDRIEAG